MGGMTILQRAAMAGRDAHVALLLDHGWVIMIMMVTMRMMQTMSFRVNPNLSTKEQPWRPVLLAAQRGHHRVLAVLATHTEKAAGVYIQTKILQSSFYAGQDDSANFAICIAIETRQRQTGLCGPGTLRRPSSILSLKSLTR